LYGCPTQGCTNKRGKHATCRVCDEAQRDEVDAAIQQLRHCAQDAELRAIDAAHAAAREAISAEDQAVMDAFLDEEEQFAAHLEERCAELERIECGPSSLPSDVIADVWVPPSASAAASAPMAPMAPMMPMPMPSWGPQWMPMMQMPMPMPMPMPSWGPQWMPMMQMPMQQAQAQCATDGCLEVPNVNSTTGRHYFKCKTCTDAYKASKGRK
jgi:hypothetical protein